MIELCKKEPCIVEKRINYNLQNLICYFKQMKEMANDNWLENIDSLKCYCDSIIDAKRRIATLALVLHPEFRYAQIDAVSFKGFIEGKESLIRIIFWNPSSDNHVYRYFKPEEKK